MKYRIEISRTQVYEFEVEAVSELDARHTGMEIWEDHAPVANSAEVAVFEIEEGVA